MWIVWDSLNERASEMFDVATGQFVKALFTSQAEAENCARLSNEFGGYSGWVSLRFFVRAA